ncbi:uncharacterized protein LOC134820726 isoform X2 [Bolinopsis microptera]|uniref:uncharacterized protein LOC134820726 isoform X2 n=1 Tax=Bolinopsis microptera TaxID=2820187 RepID=UPI00307A87E6
MAAQALSVRGDQHESDTDEGNEGRRGSLTKQTGRFRFRSIMRKVLLLVRWELKSEEFRRNLTKKRGGRRISILDDPDRERALTERGLSDRRPTRMIRLALTVQPGKRTTEMLDLIRPYINRLKCCETLNGKVRSQLPNIVEYECLDKGRFIVKQGDAGESYYLIVSGTVDVMIEEGGAPKYLNILKSGQGFGEVALVNKGPRTASIITKEPTELLRIDRDQFHEVLRASKLQEIARKQSFLRTHPSFHALPEDILKKFVDNAVIKDYKPAEMIIKVGEETVDHIVIVISGECVVETPVSLDYYKLKDKRFFLDLPSSTRPDIQRYISSDKRIFAQTQGHSCSSRIMSTPTKSSSSSCSRNSDGDRPYATAQLEEEAVSRYRDYFRNDVKSVTSRQYHLILRRIGPKEYFSVSDFIAQNKCNVGAEKKVECLLLPKILFQRFNMLSVLEDMAAIELGSTLTVEEAFERFLRRRHWEMYKKKIVSDVLKKMSNR